MSLASDVNTALDSRPNKATLILQSHKTLITLIFKFIFNSPFLKHDCLLKLKKSAIYTAVKNLLRV